MWRSYDFLVFSHLRWDFVYQRPQQLLSRLAIKSQILFIEEPIYEPDIVPYWEIRNPALNVLVLRLHTPVSTAGFHDDHLAILVPMLQQFLQEEGIQEYVTWLYTPMALPLAQSFTALAVVYDCMDELSAFLHAPPALILYEAALLTWADVVFTGGPSIYAIKRDRHSNVHCFPSSVDAAHFRQANEGIAEPLDQAALPHPRLGFFGVIDERLDLSLIETLSQSHPEWQIIMVGPVVKIDPALLPRSQNIYYLGQRNYTDLPAYIAGWDICLLPFARNDATRFISPTKVLEYMAAERPIISTPITDVVKPYGQIVSIADNADTFVAACEAALTTSSEAFSVQRAQMRAVLAQTSWDATAQAMEECIEQIISKRKFHTATRMIPKEVSSYVAVMH